jgi:hypothetical protein
MTTAEREVPRLAILHKLTGAVASGPLPPVRLDVIVEPASLGCRVGWSRWFGGEVAVEVVGVEEGLFE